MPDGCMSPDEQVDFVVQHLVGEAKSEMRLRFRGEQDVTQLLDAIEESYGRIDSATSLERILSPRPRSKGVFRRLLFGFGEDR